MSQELDVVAIRDVAIPTIDAAAFDQLDTMPEGFSLQSAYLSFKTVGEMHRVFFVGMTTMWSPLQKKEIPAAMFLWRETPQSGPKRVINSGVNLVIQLEKIPYNGAPIPMQITYQGKEKAGTGFSFDKFDVVVLNAKGGSAPPPTPTQTEQPPTVQDNKQIAASALKWIDANRQTITIKQARQTNARAVQLANDAGLSQDFIASHTSPADEMSAPAMTKHAEDLFNAVIAGKAA